MKIQIKARFTDAVLFECEIDSAELYPLRAALQAAVSKKANLRGAYLRGADLYGAYLRGADLLEIKIATPEEAVANLDRVREIILDGPQRLRMDHWHDDASKWQEHTCAEEAVCDTTHCLAGWLQVCSTDDAIRKLASNLAGIVLAPVASRMFFESETKVKTWLEKREYAKAAV